MSATGALAKMVDNVPTFQEDTTVSVNQDIRVITARLILTIVHQIPVSMAVPAKTG